jgi:glycosyltransferase involved in cell wall biosynthesis
VPVLNEAENLPRLFDAFHDLHCQFGARFRVSFILVDDGSTDGTGDAARTLAGGLDFSLLAHPTNLGPGVAFATAFTYLCPRIGAADWVATMEGDNTSRHDLLAQMFTRAQEGYSVILASPYMYGGGVSNTSVHRLLLSHVANAFVKEFLGCHGLMTVSSFFRLYRGSALRLLMDGYGPGILERAGFESMVEMVMKMVYLRMSISEVPMVLDTSRRIGRSRMRIRRTIWGYLCLWRARGRWLRA